MTILTAAARFSDLWRPRAAPSRGAIGVEVGRTWLHVVRRRRGGPQEWSLDAVPLDPQDLDGSAAASRRLRERARSAGLPRGDAICALCTPSVSIFPLALPATRPERLDLVVAGHAEKHLSRPLEEMILDYSVLPEAIRRPGEEATAALVFAAPRAIVEGVMDGLEAITLRVTRLLTPACIHARRARTGPGDRRLVLSTGEDATSISVVENGHVLLERILAWGRGTLLRRLESELRLAPEHARTLLDRDVAGAVRPADTDSPGGALREVLAPAFRELTGEAAGCLAYCSSVFRHVPVRGTLVVGALAGHEPLGEALERELGTDLEEPAGAAGLALARFATPIGCALWGQGPRP